MFDNQGLIQILFTSVIKYEKYQPGGRLWASLSDKQHRTHSHTLSRALSFFHRFPLSLSPSAPLSCGRTPGHPDEAHTGTGEKTHLKENI